MMSTGNNQIQIAIIEDGNEIGEIVTLGFSIGRPETKIFHCRSEQQVIGFTRNSDPNIVVIDLDSHEESRFELISSIRSISNVPIFTVSRDVDASKKAIALGATDTLVKPYSMSDLIMNVCLLINKTSAKS